MHDRCANVGLLLKNLQLEVKFCMNEWNRSLHATDGRKKKSSP